MQPTNKNPLKIFYFYAFLSAVAGLYHVNRFFFPSANEQATKHLIYLAISTICVFGLIKRPKWFLYFFGAVTCYLLYSNGSYLFSQWHQLHIIHYIDLCIVIMVPVIFVSLIRNRHAAS